MMRMVLPVVFMGFVLVMSRDDAASAEIEKRLATYYLRYVSLSIHPELARVNTFTQRTVKYFHGTDPYATERQVSG